MTAEAYEQYRAYNHLHSKLEKIQELVTELPTQVGVRKYDYGVTTLRPVKDALNKAIIEAQSLVTAAQDKL